MLACVMVTVLVMVISIAPSDHLLDAAYVYMEGVKIHEFYHNINGSQVGHHILPIRRHILIAPSHVPWMLLGSRDAGMPACHLIRSPDSPPSRSG